MKLRLLLIALLAAASWPAPAEATGRLLPNGNTVTTYRHGGAKVDVSAEPGTTVDFGADGITLTAPATGHGAKAMGGTAVGNLVAMGVPPVEALAFADLDQGPLTASIDLAVSPSKTVPWRTQCLTVNSADAYGYGCSTAFLFARNVPGMGYWWLETKYKVSLYAKKPCVLCNPLRPTNHLSMVKWTVAWTVHDRVYDWAPDAKIKKDECKTVSLNVSGTYGGLGVSVPVCNGSLDATGLTSTKSGGIWRGNADEQSYRTAGGAQSVKSTGNVIAVPRFQSSVDWETWVGFCTPVNC